MENNMTRCLEIIKYLHYEFMIYKLTDQGGPNCTQCHMLLSNKIRVPIFLAKDKMKSFCFLFFYILLSRYCLNSKTPISKQTKLGLRGSLPQCTEQIAKPGLEGIH